VRVPCNRRWRGHFSIIDTFRELLNQTRGVEVLQVRKQRSCNCDLNGTAKTNAVAPSASLTWRRTRQRPRRSLTWDTDSIYGGGYRLLSQTSKCTWAPLLKGDFVTFLSSH